MWLIRFADPSEDDASEDEVKHPAGSAKTHRQPPPIAAPYEMTDRQRSAQIATSRSSLRTLYTVIPPRAYRTTSVFDLLRHWLPDYLRTFPLSPKCIRIFSTRRCLIGALQESVDGMTAMRSLEVRIHWGCMCTGIWRMRRARKIRGKCS